MAAMTILRSTFRPLLLLTIFTLGVVSSKNEQASFGSSLIHLTTQRSVDNFLNATVTKDNETEKSSSTVKLVQNVQAKEISWEKDDDGKDEEEETDDEYEEIDESGGEIDEYEDELKEIAESHEAMLRNESKNMISSTMSLSRSVNENPSFSLKNFESRENDDQIMSDEKLVSNEAVPKDDEEVAELLRYKQKAALLVEKKLVSGVPELGTKVKRVPTVKKELSTQKEILNANETELSIPKTLVSNVEIVNRLDDERKPETGLGISLTSRDSNRYELVEDDRRFDEEYPDFETSDDIIRKLDKRQPFNLNSVNPYLIDTYNSEQERRHKLRELGIDENASAEDLMELFLNLAENPQLLKKIHQVLAYVADHPIAQESLTDSRKRSNSPNSPFEMSPTVTEPDPTDNSPTTKKPKKKKKKKKKIRQRLPKTTSTNEPPITTVPKTPINSSPTPPFLSTTVANWPATTQAQWRLVAERLFGNAWSENHREISPDTAEVRFINDRLPSIDEKERANLQALNNERQALMMESAREYSQPRRLHYGKVNTHEKGSPISSQDDAITNYNIGRNVPVNDYDLSDSRLLYRPRSNPLDRYDRYGYYGRQRMREYGLFPVEDEHENDYDEISRASHDISDHRPFARTHQFKPLGREYASTKTWQDSRYDYARPWKDKGRTSLNGISESTGKWPWKSTSLDYKIWIPRYQQTWPRDKNYWQRLSHVGNELNEMSNVETSERGLPAKNQQRQHEQTNWRPQHDESGRWKIDQNVDIKSWQINDRPKIYSHEILPTSLEKSKNLSELSNKVIIVKSSVKEKPILPKITMKTWNSLTSDPATWPFKLTGAKPWPKDKNGKSYNPNAELVRKLGLDKQDRLLSSSKDINSDIAEKISSHTSMKNEITDNSKIDGNNRNEINAIVKSVKNSIDWPEKLNAVNEWMDKSRKENERLPQRDEARQSWQTSLDNDKKMWSEKSPISPKISSVGAWIMPADQSTWKPYDVKHKIYGQSSEDRRDRWSDRSNSLETDKNSWPTKNEVISGGWPEKNNDWNIVGPAYPPDKSASTINSSTWPSKWRQFAYHKVTAAPVTKPGSLSIVDASNKPRNSYIAVSAVSPPKYPNNEWRRNDIEQTQLEDRNSDDNHVMKFVQDYPGEQLRKSTAKERWNKQERIDYPKENNHQRNHNDPLEHQLEALRREPYWNHDQLHEQSQKRSNTSGNSSIVAITTETTKVPKKSSSKNDEILKNHVESITVNETLSQEKKNVTN